VGNPRKRFTKRGGKNRNISQLGGRVAKGKKVLCGHRKRPQNRGVITGKKKLGEMYWATEGKKKSRRVPTPDGGGDKIGQKTNQWMAGRNGKKKSCGFLVKSQ